MRLTTYLDFNLVALERDDRLTLMLELAAPPAPTRPPRAPAAIEVVLDRSDSMRGTPLRSAQIALDRLIDWLDAEDGFGLVTFDRQAEIVVPAGPLGDKSAVRNAIAQIESGSGSALSSGYGCGLAEAARIAGARGATVVVISDGFADLGIDSPRTLERHAAGAHAHGLTTTTLALGHRADGRLLRAMALGGVGAALAATGPDVAAALLAGEVDGLLQAAVQSVQLELHAADFVSSLEVINDVPAVPTGDGLTIELGDLNHSERRSVVVSVALERVQRPGEMTVAEVLLEYVTLPSLVPHSFRLPLTVTAVPAAEAEARVAEPTVTNEAAFQRVRRARSRISEVHDAGAASPTARALAASSAELEQVLASAPVDLRDDLAQAIMALDETVVRGLMPRLSPSLHRRGARPRR